MEVTSAWFMQGKSLLPLFAPSGRSPCLISSLDDMKCRCRVTSDSVGFVSCVLDVYVVGCVLYWSN